MAKKRQITDEEKAQVIEMQKGTDGSLRCYISGDIIDPATDEIEFDHIIAFATDGPSDLEKSLYHFTTKHHQLSLKNYLIK